MSQRMSKRELERAVRTQGVVLVVTLSLVGLLIIRLNSKGVLPLKDLLADA